MNPVYPRSTLIWHLTNRGFGSEISVLLLARAYARMKGFDFAVCSRYWNSHYQRGWGDYFEPFCDQFDHPHNVQLSEMQRSIAERWQRNVLFLEDVWPTVWNRNFLSLPLIDPSTNGVASDFWTAMRAEMALVWRLTPLATQRVNQLAAKHIESLGARFSAVHIRRGDKVTEAPNTAIEDYAAWLTQPGSPPHVFVMTDDYSVIEPLRRAAPALTFTTLCQPTQLGHEQRAFNARTPEARYQDTLQLIAELSVAARAQRYLGTGSSNISRVLALLRGPDRVESIGGPLDYFYLAPG